MIRKFEEGDPVGNNIRKEINVLFSSWPDVLYGFSDVAFSDYKSDYRSALVFAVPHSRKLTLADYKEIILEEQIHQARESVNEITAALEIFLENNQINYSVPPVAQKSEEELIAPFSFKYSAVLAGLGWIGKNDMLITERYGPRVRLGAVLMDYPVTLSGILPENKCPKDCFSCADACPYGALSGQLWNPKAKRSQLIDFQLCNKKRSLFIKNHKRKHSCGYCMAACPIGLK